MGDSSPIRKGKKRKYEGVSESLEARKEEDRKRVTSRINIGENIQEWIEIKEKLGCSTHAVVAKVLLDR